MADEKIRRDPDELDLDDEFVEEDGGGIAELPADPDDDEFDD